MTIAWTLHPAAELDRYAATWNALNAEAGALPFLDTKFLVPLLAAFGSGQERIAFATRGAACVAAAIVEPIGPGRWQTIQPSQLPLGAWISRKDEAIYPLQSALIRKLPGFVVELGLTQLDPDFVRRPADGPQLSTLDYIDTAWVDVAGDFDTYWNARGKNLRSNARKQRNKLEADGVTVAFDVLSSADDVAAAIAEYGRLETASWKAGTGTAVSPDNAQGRFYREMMEAFCASGRGEIWRYRFDDVVVAMDLCIAAGRKLVILKTAFDSSQKTISPASLLHQDAFRRVFEQGHFDRIEFYGRVMEWHTRWTEQKRVLFHATAYRWSLVGQSLALLRRLRASREDGLLAEEARAGES
jgi:CelD/BcsL family acetyltransferase involved in cellulose biosynthesis